MLTMAIAGRIYGRVVLSGGYLCHLGLLTTGTVRNDRTDELALILAPVPSGPPDTPPGEPQ
jgi:hypothetical protein